MDFTASSIFIVKQSILVFFFDISDFYSDEVGNHAQLYQLGGVTTRHKTIVGVDITGDSFSAQAVADRIIEIIRRAKKSGVSVTAVSMDMGPCNLGV